MKTDKEVLDEYCNGWGLDDTGKKAMEDTFGFKNHLLWVRIFDLRDAIIDRLWTLAQIIFRKMPW